MSPNFIPPADPFRVLAEISAWGARYPGRFRLSFNISISASNYVAFNILFRFPHIMDPAKTTNDLIQLLEERGTGDYIGESISQLEHCLQCANFGLKSGMLFRKIHLRCGTYSI